METPEGNTHSREYRPVSRRLWNTLLGAIGLTLATALGLIVALALGWNNPRPVVPPDWQHPGPAPRLVAPSGRDVVALHGFSGDDLTLEAEARPLSCPAFNGYGLVYRAQDSAHYTVFAVSGDGYYAVLKVNGDEETALVDWQQFPHIRRGQQSNRLRVACIGPTCRFYINDEYAATVVDDTWLAGDIGLWACSFGEEEVTVQFQDVRVWVE